MSSDLRAALLRYKPEKHRARLAPRARGRLVGRHGYQPDRPADAGTRRQHLHHGGHTAEAARLLLERSLLFHCSVCLAELATGVANYNSAGPDWRRVRDYYTALFDTIPDSRILSPDDQAWIDAGVIAGSLSRIQNFHKDQRKECLNDALIYLTAAKAGLSVLTANTVDFDLIRQLAPGGRFIHL